MAYNREGYAPWSLTREAGVESATVDGTIEVPQYVQPTIDTGFVDEKGDWKGRKSSDKNFIAISTDVGIPNTGEILTPSVNADGTWPLDMEGFQDIQIAIKPTSGGNYSITGVMGPDTLSYANLNPVNPAATLRGNWNGIGNESDLEDLFIDGSESLSADVWNIFIIQGRLSNQKLLQFKIINNSGAESDIQTAFRRLV
tara:strand:+ start:114 stop:710 length:597 start_codon:yes stop_codon:yes gene_type:complete